MKTFGRFEDETTIQHQKEAQLKSIQITHTKKGKINYTSEQLYNKYGRLSTLHIHMLDDNANLVQRKIYRYIRKGSTKLIYDYSYSYNNKNLLETSRNNLNKNPS